MCKSFITTYALVAFILLCAPIQKAYSQDNETIAQTVIHLLSYVSMDYSGAVKDGEVINEQEYKEQVEFSSRALSLTKKNSFLSEAEKETVLTQLQQLSDRVNQLKPATAISTVAEKAINNIIRFTGIQTAPKVWPNLAKGKALYAQNCALCHGQNGKGDGPAGRSLDPIPSNFHDIDLMLNVSPYQAYSSIRLGVPGTAMVSFSGQFSDEEMWDLAFYIKSLRFRKTVNDTTQLRKIFTTNKAKIGLAEVATLSDQKLLDTLSTVGNQPQKVLKALRLLMPIGTQINNSLPIAKKGLEAALKSYASGDKDLARTQAISAYLEGIEPVEAQLRTQNADFVQELETKMFNVRQAIDKDNGVAAVKEKVNIAVAAITQAGKIMQSQQLNYWLTFIISATIFLREALEAFLILAVVLALIRSTGAKKALPYLHGGWITALLCGVAGWFLSDYIIQFGGKNREVMEGVISLFAVAVLMFMGFWLHNKSEAQQWTKFIKEKIGNYLKTDRMIGLAAFSFVVVFREAFEVVLFLRAVSLEAAAENQSAIGFGVIAGVVCVAIIAVVFLKYSRLIPVRKLFQWSSWVILLLAIILIGKGFHALQESGWIAVTNLTAMLRIEWLGIYPTLQTIAAQIGLIVLVLLVYLVNNQRHKRLVLQQK